jgi:hypothetical protein
MYAYPKHFHDDIEAVGDVDVKSVLEIHHKSAHSQYN